MEIGKCPCFSHFLIDSVHGMTYNALMENQRIKKARKFLKTARTLIETGDNDSCISRCYYALFHAAVALLEKFGITHAQWEHKFVLAAFSLELVHKRKVMPSESREVLRFLFYQRNEADYKVEEKTAKKAKRAGHSPEFSLSRQVFIGESQF